jgi:hypothetical protein
LKCISLPHSTRRRLYSAAKWSYFDEESSVIYFCSIIMFGAETWTHRRRDHKYLESFKMWCWRRMQKIGWTGHVKNKEVLHRVTEERKI